MIYKQMRFFLLCFTLTSYAQSTDLFVQEKNNLPNEKMEFNLFNEKEKKKPDWKSFLECCAPALGISTCIGATCGLICALMENKKILPWQISWLLMWGTRDTAIHLISKDMKKNNIPHNKRLCYMSARVVDWIIYLFFKSNYYDSFNL